MTATTVDLVRSIPDADAGLTVRVQTASGMVVGIAKSFRVMQNSYIHRGENFEGSDR